jgi:hypothetical protein
MNGQLMICYETDCHYETFFDSSGAEIDLGGVGYISFVLKRQNKWNSRKGTQKTVLAYQLDFEGEKGSVHSVAGDFGLYPGNFCH